MNIVPHAAGLHRDHLDDRLTPLDHGDRAADGRSTQSSVRFAIDR